MTEVFSALWTSQHRHLESTGSIKQIIPIETER
jgi:hypothetical protein